ncbi:MAG: FAD-dependent oxidoreductase [Candidatus Acidiferrales bacterium]
MAERIQTQCCIVGGGPAGMMLGFLLARGGIDVVVLEKHKDFLRDFRGDTIHPSTLELMYELGILKEFLKRPHQKVTQLSGQIGRETVTIADFTHLPTHCKFVALMPQWDFLNFIAEQARTYQGFRLKMEAKATGLIEDAGRIAGVHASAPGGLLEILADLTVGADGRGSTIRKSAGLQVVDLGAPMDVMWMRLSRRESDPGQTFGHVERGKMMVILNREDYWQCAFVIPKGTAEDVKTRGLPAFRGEIAELEPFLQGRLEELQDWEAVSVLTVSVDRLVSWSRPGLLCIGDAAHAMSPIGGVGINLAIQDAVATANILGPKLLRGRVTEDDLKAVQSRRMFPTRATQSLQVAIQNNVISRVLTDVAPLNLPWLLKLIRAIPYLRRFPARVVGMGFRPEHVKFPAHISKGKTKI